MDKGKVILKARLTGRQRLNLNNPAIIAVGINYASDIEPRRGSID